MHFLLRAIGGISRWMCAECFVYVYYCVLGCIMFVYAPYVFFCSGCMFCTVVNILYQCSKLTCLPLLSTFEILTLYTFLMLLYFVPVGRCGPAKGREPREL